MYANTEPHVTHFTVAGTPSLFRTPNPWLTFISIEGARRKRSMLPGVGWKVISNWSDGSIKIENN